MRILIALYTLAGDSLLGFIGGAALTALLHRWGASL